MKQKSPDASTSKAFWGGSVCGNIHDLDSSEKRVRPPSTPQSYFIKSGFQKLNS